MWIWGGTCGIVNRGTGMACVSRYRSPLGPLLLAERDERLVGLWMEGQKHFLGSLRGSPLECRVTPVLRRTERWLDRYFAGEKPSIAELPLAPIGSVFRNEVWKVLCGIPYGKTVTYGEISRELAVRRGGGRVSARAVGGAVGHNPISIVIPCHRVVGSNGGLVGYAGGLQRKITLLAHEGVDVGRFLVPEGEAVSQMGTKACAWPDSAFVPTRRDDAE